MTRVLLASYRTRFEKMVERLRAHPDIALLNFHMAEPVSAAKLASVEKKLTVPLDPAIAAFCRQCDGLSLRWISKRHPDYDPKRMRFSSRRLSWLDVVRTDGEEDGCVCILPLEQVLVKMSWKDRISPSLAHYGSVAARFRLYNKVFGHRQKPLLHSRAQWEEQPPSLEKILKQAEKEWP